MNSLAALPAQVMDQLYRIGASLPLRLGIAVIALLANIAFYLPKVPSATPGVSIPGLDKVVHVAIFALTVWAIGRLLAPLKRFPMGWVVILAAVHAGLIELLHTLLPNRSADPWDLVADLGGIVLGLGCWWYERRLIAQQMEDNVEDEEYLEYAQDEPQA